MSILKNRKSVEIKSFGIVNGKESHAHERNKKSILLNKVIYDSSITYEEPVKLMVKFVGPEGNIYDLSFGDVYSIDYWPKDKYFEVQTFKNGEYIYYQILKEDVIDVFEIGATSIRDLFPMSTLKPLLKENLNNPHGVSGYKLPRGSGKSRALLSRQTGMDCFDLEPGHIPEVSILTNEEPKNIYEELEELFVKQNEHIKVLLISGAGKDDVKSLAILDYKNKTSESVNGYDLLLALDCLIPNLTKEGLEHFIKVASEALDKKTITDNSLIEGINGEKKAPYFNGYKPNFYFKQRGEKLNDN